MRLSHFKKPRILEPTCYVCNQLVPSWHGVDDPSLVAVFPQRYRAGEVTRWELWLASHTEDLRSHRKHVTLCIEHAEQMHLLWEAMVAAELLEAKLLAQMYARGERL